MLSEEVRSSPEKLKRLLSADFMEIGVSGRCFYLKDVLEQLTYNSKLIAYIQGVQFFRLSNTLIQLIYQLKSKKDEADKFTFSQRTSLWRKENNRWKMFYHQATACGVTKS